MRLEPKPTPPLGVTSLLVLAAGASPFSVFYLVARGAAGTQCAALETLTRATPLIFTGLAVAVAFRAKLWNIGAEAQLYIGGVVTIVLGTGALPLPSFLLIPLIMLAAMAESRGRCAASPNHPGQAPALRLRHRVLRRRYRLGDHEEDRARL